MHLVKKLALASLLLLSAAPVWADGTEPDFQLMNSSGTAISAVFISAPGAAPSTANQLSAPLADGGNVQIKYTSTDKRCVFDIKVITSAASNGLSVTGADLCKADKITVKKDALLIE